MPYHILHHRQRKSCHCNRQDTLGIIMGNFIDSHPYIAFLAFLGIAFGLMALVGLNDAMDRAIELGLT